jgi:hypothetical protein
MALRRSLKLHLVGLKSRLSPIAAAKQLGFKGKTARALLPEVEAAIEELNKQVTRIVEPSEYCAKDDHLGCVNNDKAEHCGCDCHDGPDGFENEAEA